MPQAPFVIFTVKSVKMPPPSRREAYCVSLKPLISVIFRFVHRSFAKSPPRFFASLENDSGGDSLRMTACCSRADLRTCNARPYNKVKLFSTKSILPKKNCTYLFSLLSKRATFLSPALFYLSVKLGEGIGKGAAAVNKTALHRFVSVDKTSRISCYLIRSCKHGSEIFLTYR